MKKPPPTNRERRAQTCFKLSQLRALEEINRSSASHIIGIDESGIGCLAGPLVVAGVAVPKGWSHPDVKDSKMLSPKQRARVLQEVIYEQELVTCMLYRHAHDIDEVGIRKSIHQLTEGVALYLLRRLPDALVVQDGEDPVPVEGSLKNVVYLAKADRHVPAVSAASILAKESHDLYMREQHQLYPHWDFESNVGYPSLKHRQAVAKHGLSPIHRVSYGALKKYLQAL